MRLTTLKSKISLMSTIETRPFWPYSYILWKVVYRNIRYMCIILVANIIWRSGHVIPSSFLLDFSFLHHSYRRVFITVFYVTAMQHMIVLTARFMGTLIGRQIVVSMHKRMVKENSLGSITSIFEYVITWSVYKNNEVLYLWEKNFVRT